jgi:hypothetical protein
MCALDTAQQPQLLPICQRLRQWYVCAGNISLRKFSALTNAARRKHPESVPAMVMQVRCDKSDAPLPELEDCLHFHPSQHWL